MLDFKTWDIQAPQKNIFRQKWRVKVESAMKMKINGARSVSWKCGEQEKVS